MSPDDRQRALRLLEILRGGAAAQKTTPPVALEQAADFADFRVRLMLDEDFGPTARAVVDHWRAETTRRVERPDANELLLLLERAAHRQRDIDVEMGRVDAELQHELRGLDEMCKVLSGLRQQLRRTRANVEQYRSTVLHRDDAKTRGG